MAATPSPRRAPGRPGRHLDDAGSGSRTPRPFATRAARVPRRTRPPRPDLRRPGACRRGSRSPDSCWPSSPSGSSTRPSSTPRNDDSGWRTRRTCWPTRPGRPSPAIPARSDRFDELLTDARAIGPLTETHNYWIDRMAQASLRRFVVRVGRRLADAGSIAHGSGRLPPSLATRSPTSCVTAADRRAVDRRRARDLARWSRDPPPGRVGKATRATDGEGDRFDGVRIASTDPDELRGARRVGRDRPRSARA